MNQNLLSSAAQAALRRRYDKLKQELSSLSWISQGSVMQVPPRAWRWTRKVKAKTVSVALSVGQAAHYREAIAEHRRLEEILREMREISQRILQTSAPGVRRRKPPAAS
jgi:hypothetical protein